MDFFALMSPFCGMYKVKTSSHVTTPKFGPKFCSSKFGIVLMATGTLVGRVGVGPIKPEFQFDLANCH